MGDKQFGRYKRKPKSRRYWDSNRRFHNKVKRVRRSSGDDAASEYTRKYLRRL